MADWFETRFPESEDTEELDPAFAARMRALVLKEWQQSETPAPPSRVVSDIREEDVVMIEIEERPAVHEEEPKRPKSPGRWLLVAAAIVLVVVVGALLTDSGGKDDDSVGTVATNPPVETANPVPQGENFFPLEPGKYFIDPDGDPNTPMRVTFDIETAGWMSWLGTAKFVGGDQLNLSIMTVSNIVSDACRDHTPRDPAVGPTVDDLATALTQLAPFTVSSPPADVTIRGYRGKHLQLMVPANLMASGEHFDGCVDGELHSWFSPIHDGSFFGYNAEPGRTEDFYILDVEGTRLVLETSTGPKTRQADADELEAIFDSIRIEP